MNKLIVSSISVVFSAVLLANTASAQLMTPASSPLNSHAEQVNCAPSLSEKDCLIETAKKVVKTGKEILLGKDLISVAKALSILKKFGISM